MSMACGWSAETVTFSARSMITRAKKKRQRAAKPVVLGLEARALLASWSVSGAGAGSPPGVRVFNPYGIEANHFLAFDASFRGGVQVAVGDVSGDGTREFVTATGPDCENKVGGD